MLIVGRTITPSQSMGFALSVPRIASPSSKAASHAACLGRRRSGCQMCQGFRSPAGRKRVPLARLSSSLSDALGDARGSRSRQVNLFKQILQDTAMDAFAALADPTRRRIVELLGRGERAAGAIVDE